MKSGGCRRAISILLLAVTAGCGGNEESDAVASFAASDCKKDAQLDGTLPSFLLTEWDGDALLGLTCVAWSGDGAGEVALDLINFGGACGAQWAGDAELTGGQLEISVTNPGCLLAGCGSCLYDWSFELSGLATDDELPVRIEVDACPEESDYESDHYETALPAGGSAEGIQCRWGDWSGLVWHAGSTGACGQLHMPCGQSNDMMCAEDGPVPCAGDLVCADRGDGHTVCLAPCEADADCPLDGVLLCAADGLCAPAQSW